VNPLLEVTVSHPARWKRLIPLALAAALAVGAGGQVQAATPPDPKAQAYAQDELVQLLRVSTPTAADKQRLSTLDLDLAESAGKRLST
jgi:carboxypeptidase T